MVALYTMEGCQVKNPIRVGETVYSMSFSPDGGELACGTGCDIRMYHVKSGILVLGPLKLRHGLFDMVPNVVWSRDGSRLFSVSNKTIRCWHSATEEQIGHPWTGRTGWICSLVLSPDGSILASASQDKIVRFWDAATGTPIGQGLNHDKRVDAVRFSPSGEFVASAGYDEGIIYLWRVPWSNSIKDGVITPFMYVLALALTLLQASPTLPGIDFLPGFDFLYASVSSIGPFV